MAHAASERGAANATVADVVERAGVSRRTFYEIFSSCEDCLMVTLEDALACTSVRVLPAYEMAGGAWRARVRAGLVALLRLFDEQPHLARLLIVEWLAAGPRALHRREEVIGEIAGALDEGRTGRHNIIAAEGVVGAVASVLHGRLVRSPPEGALIELVNPLMSIIVLPFLGAAVARRELELPVPDVSGNGSGDRAHDEPLKGLDMRLTYRTMRVLAAAADHPGSSNRAIGQAAGIDDQGQISKLLARLQRLELLENKGRAGKGEPNAWWLTAVGEQVEGALRISHDGRLSRQT